MMTLQNLEIQNLLLHTEITQKKIYQLDIEKEEGYPLKLDPFIHIIRNSFFI